MQAISLLEGQCLTHRYTAQVQRVATTAVRGDNKNNLVHNDARSGPPGNADAVQAFLLLFPRSGSRILSVPLAQPTLVVVKLFSDWGMGNQEADLDIRTKLQMVARMARRCSPHLPRAIGRVQP